MRKVVTLYPFRANVVSSPIASHWSEEQPSAKYLKLTFAIR